MSIDKARTVSQDRNSFLKKGTYFKSLHHNKLLSYREKTSRMKSSFSQIGQKYAREISEEILCSKRKKAMHLSSRSVFMPNKTITDRINTKQTEKLKKIKFTKAKKVIKNMFHLPNLKKYLQQRRESEGKTNKVNSEQIQLFMNNSLNIELQSQIAVYMKVNFKRDYQTKVVFSKVKRHQL